MKTIKPIYKVVSLMAIAALLSTSCRISSARTQHVPLFEEKGEMQIAAQINPNVGGELQVDYAVGNKVYLMTDFSHNFPGVHDAFGSYRAYYGTFGVGAYNAFGKYGRVSIYGGPTFGRINKTYNHDYHLVTFIGADWGMARPKFETALSFKFSYNWYGDVGTYQSYEPAWTIRFGGERLKFNTQLGIALHQGDGGFGNYTASFGFTYRMRTLKEIRI